MLLPASTLSTFAPWDFLRPGRILRLQGNMTPFSKRKNGQRGVVLVMTAVLTIVLFALLGMAVDLGRMFIIKHEAQVFTDADALAGAVKLDGTQAGIIASNNAVDPGTNKWNMGTQGFSVVGAASYTTKFSNSVSGPWVAAGSVPVNATGYVYVKVTAALTVPVYFIGVVV